MRKLITPIMITSILGLGVTSCSSTRSNFFKQARREATEQAESKLIMREGLELTEKAERRRLISKDAFQAVDQSNKFNKNPKTLLKTADESKRSNKILKPPAKLILSRQQSREKIYDAAYDAALDYLESRANQVSYTQANEIAANAASNENQKLGHALTDTTVTGLASFATTAAYTNYQENHRNKR